MNTSEITNHYLELNDMLANHRLKSIQALTKSGKPIDKIKKSINLLHDIHGDITNKMLDSHEEFLSNG